jgi:hypothetical protein
MLRSRIGRAEADVSFLQDDDDELVHRQVLFSLADVFLLDIDFGSSALFQRKGKNNLH